MILDTFIGVGLFALLFYEIFVLIRDEREKKG